MKLFRVDEEQKEKMIKEMRFAIDTQMRYKLYRDPNFPFLHSLGIKHMFQGFKDDQNALFIGVYHLYWTPEDSGITVLNPTKPVAKGLWKHEWLNEEEADALQKEIQDKSPVDYDKMTQAIQSAMLEIHQNIKAKKEAMQEMEEEDPILN
jgi:hypothetical protein